MSGRRSSRPPSDPIASPMPIAAPPRAERIGKAEGPWRDTYPVGRARVGSTSGGDSGDDARHQPSLSMITTPARPPANAARRVIGSSNTDRMNLTEQVDRSEDAASDPPSAEQPHASLAWDGGPVHHERAGAIVHATPVSSPTAGPPAGPPAGARPYQQPETSPLPKVQPAHRRRASRSGTHVVVLLAVAAQHCRR